MTTAETLADAWLDRANRQARELDQAHDAPALFTPARVAHVMWSWEYALDRLRYWTGIGAA